MTNQLDPELVDCSKLVDDLSAEIEKLSIYIAEKKFSCNDHVKRYALCYAAQCLDFSKALLVLQGQDAVVSQYAIWRSLFEAYVRFSYLIAAGKDCKEIQIQRLQNLQLEAFEDELTGINDVELDLSDKDERRASLKRRIDALKSEGAKSERGISDMLKVLTSSKHTNGWYPFFRMCSAKTHSRLTDLDRVYGQDGGGMKFPALQEAEECHFVFNNACLFLSVVGSGIQILWSEG